MIALETSLRNFRLDAIATIIGPSPILRLYADADTLAEIELPANWLLPAADGVKSMNAPWPSGTILRNGTATGFGILQAGTNVEMITGTTTAAGGGGDMILTTLTYATGQTFSVSSFALTEGNPV